MTSVELATPESVADWLRARAGWGQALSKPYARRLDDSGRPEQHSLRALGDDPLARLAEGLIGLSWPISGEEGGLSIQTPAGIVRLSATRNSPGAGPPEAYLVSTGDRPAYIGNAAEVIVELVRGILVEAADLPVVEASTYDLDSPLQVGFPGQTGELTYVGSWQWNIHGEALGEEYVRRAVAATQAAIDRRSTA